MNKLLNLLHKENFIASPDDVPELEPIPNTQYVFGGLNLVYGLDGTGKSWQVVVNLQQSNTTNLYLDTDGSNGRSFVQHCTDNNVHYIHPDRFLEITENSLLDKTKRLIKFCIDNTEPEDKVVFVLDSLTSLGEGQKINNAEDITPLILALNSLVIHKPNAAIVLIDHATEGKDYPNGFKLEGNAGAKRRACVTVNRYLPIEPTNPAKGGRFKCERSRDGVFTIGSELKVTNIPSLEEALDKLNQKLPEIFTGKPIPQSNFTEKTKHSRDQWLREYKDTLFDTSTKGRIKLLTLKPEYFKKE